MQEKKVGPKKKSRRCEILMVCSSCRRGLGVQGEKKTVASLKRSQQWRPRTGLRGEENPKVDSTVEDEKLRVRSCTGTPACPEKGKKKGKKQTGRKGGTRHSNNMDREKKSGEKGRCNHDWGEKEKTVALFS